jgi:hypothetical protein
VTLSNFISKLNWRLILIHLIACGFFIYSFLVFSYLHDHKFLMGFLNRPKNWFHNPQNWHFDISTFSNAALWISLSKPLGLLIGFLISLAITIKKHWYWVNSLIVFFVAFLLLRYNLFGWHYLSYVFLVPGSLFKEYSIGYFLVNGLLMLAIGLLLFFLRRVQQFINPIWASEKRDEVIQQERNTTTPKHISKHKFFFGIKTTRCCKFLWIAVSSK